MGIPKVVGLQVLQWKTKFVKMDELGVPIF